MGRTPEGPWYRAERDAWYVTLGGKQVLLSEGKKNKKAAREAFHRLMAERKAARQRGPGVSIAALCDLFCEHLDREKSPIHARTTRERLQRFAKALGGKTDATSLKPHQITAWLAGTTWGPTTRHGYITTVKSLLNWSKREGLIPANPIEDMAKPTPVAREADLTEEQADAILAAVKDQPFRDFLTALRETGMRPSEAMRLEAGMIDFEATVIVTTGKGRDRVVHLSAGALELFRRLAKLWPDGPLLRNMRGRPWTRNATACRFARLRDKLDLGKEATAESFRHGFATDGLERGVPIATMAELMGHRSTKMIERHYSKLRQRKEHLAEAVRKVRPGESTPTDT